MTGNLGRRLILAFNITQEIFNEVPLPEIATSEIKYVSLLGKCLCITVSCNGTNKFDVWVMKEYGYRYSWCKLFTFVGEWCFNSPLMSLKPLCYSSDRSKVLLEVKFRGDFKSDPKKKLFWYYLKSYKVTYVPRIPNFIETMIYAGILLPPSLPS
ncbi:putative F-box associated domain, type 1 [Medicago truncatula]|uniref:F-box and associated interaction domain protein n=1 Tax=Medicago truncatula TaxID=3880 RepID=G7J387_MEDTR|nr:F-box and associated interaction domain protein [Medicago truncatula]RHN69357.1 putative F-box associated domain, type 1 [Medicago truncatula]